MRWPLIWQIVRREVRDQLRDRRTLFMVFVLPVLLYPLLGFGLVKLTEAFAVKPRRVVIVGAEHLPDDPPLLNEAKDGFAAGLFESPEESSLVLVAVAPPGSPWGDADARRALLREGEADAVVLIPPDIRDRLASTGAQPVPIAYYSADDKSQNTYLRVDRLLARWSKRIGDERLARDNKPPDFAEPVKAEALDVASREESGAAVWARLFPFLLVMMALTGAFYPAIDLCAGEKERGTMETLLITPARRSEIVLGKFFTVMLASMVTALLNIVGMGLTGYRLAGSLGAARPNSPAAAMIHPPPVSSLFWMVLLLIPLSAFFAALCLSLAVLARSMKEGQYYLTPLYLVALPLIFMTLAPGVELNLFYSLLPITGASLLLKALMLGEYTEARRYMVPVLVPTAIYGALALRWAVDQFHKESVLFREAERFDLKDWVVHLVRDRGPTPTPGQAAFCFVTMLAAAWFVGLSVSPTPLGIVAGQVGYVLLPALAFTLLLTSSPARTLRLRWPRARDLAIAALLVPAFNPLQMELRSVVETYLPLSEAARLALESLMKRSPDVLTAVLVFAIIPALCEEAAFRGFILSGLETGRRALSAIVISALLFALMHVIVSLTQQFFNTLLMGLILGGLAVKSRSLLPGVVFHALNNAAAVGLGTLSARPGGLSGLTWLYRDPENLLYHGPWIALGTAVAAIGLVVLWRSPGVADPPAEDGHPEPIG